MRFFLLLTSSLTHFKNQTRMKKTLGGDRLGSGKKMQVELHNYGRSTHDLGYIWRSTMSPGTLVPFLSKVALPGDTWDINLDCDIKTHPTIGPLFGSYKVQLDVFQAPIRLYNALLHNNHLGIGLNMAQVKFPLIRLTAQPFGSDLPDDLDNSQINPSSLLAHLGLRGIGRATTPGNTTRTFNAIPILAYWEIYKNYYANKQEEIGAVLHTPSVALIQTVQFFELYALGTPHGSPTAIIPQTGGVGAGAQVQAGYQIALDFVGATPDPQQIYAVTQQHGLKSMYELVGGNTFTTGTRVWGWFDHSVWGDTDIDSWDYINSTTVNTGKPAVATFDLAEIDNMRMDLLAAYSTTVPFELNDADGGAGREPYKWLYEQPNTIPNILSSQEGLALKTYQSDLFNNWLQTEWIDGVNGITAVTAIDTSGGSFTLDTLNLSKKVYDMLNRIAVSGGSYNDWMDAVYTHERYYQAETPMYMGGLIKELVFQEVVSNANAGEQPLGTLAGKGIMGKKHKGGTVVIKVDEPSYILGIISLTPRIDYSQGNSWDLHLKTLDDVHKPALDEIGFQELITEQMAWWSTELQVGGAVTKSAGKQPAWINYMTSVNVVRGNFAIAQNEMFMTLNRRYEYDAGDIADLTTYIDPSKFNHIFAQTSLDAQNFWAQIAVDITYRGKISARIMPNL